MIEIVELPELTVIGIKIEAPWQQLPIAVPQAWSRLFESGAYEGTFLEVSFGAVDDVYREFVGYLAKEDTAASSGLNKCSIPAGQYLRLLHDGPLSDIPNGFSQLHDYAESKGLGITELKLDIGYAPGLPDGPHELHVRLAAGHAAPAQAENS